MPRSSRSRPAYADLEQSFGTLRTLVFSSEEATLINEFIVISQNISRIRSHFANGHLGLIHWHVEAIRESFRKMFPPTGPPARNDLKTLESYIYKIIVAGVAAAGVGSASSIQDTKILHTVLVGVSLMTVSRWAVILYQKRVATALKERALILAGGLLTLIGLISLIRNGFFEQDVSNSQAALTIAAIIGLFGLPDALRIYVANEVDVKLHHDNQIVRQCLEVAPTAGVIVGFLIGKFWI